VLELVQKSTNQEQAVNGSGDQSNNLVDSSHKRNRINHSNQIESINRPQRFRPNQIDLGKQVLQVGGVQIDLHEDHGVVLVISMREIINSF